jgi:hypothetical protein
MNDIPSPLAQNLCLEISAASRHRRWYSAYAWWCWGCAKFNGDVSKRCFANQPDNRGCAQVNARYARLHQMRHADYRPNEF